ncbi:hypothetical protein C8A05DRAFT_34627 [Staphylotrichum tortipilum]|uniref:Uncharacterized protein n=1 Tax=Staphylotrichum tortipilum TaxID=2831512 RepID=A0AAN6RSZ7_9PEZI|nr:hypothetical protein C8A05DRAFT_34627 [Staphylotrichum longicolle]
MPSTSSLHLAAPAAVAAILLQPPARLAGLIEATGPVLISIPLLVFVLAPVLALSPWSCPPSTLPETAARVTFWMATSAFVTIDSGLRDQGRLAEVVDQLLRDEERRSALESEIYKLRTNYKN